MAFLHRLGGMHFLALCLQIMLAVLVVILPALLAMEQAQQIAMLAIEDTTGMDLNVRLVVMDATIARIQFVKTALTQLILSTSTTPACRPATPHTYM